MSNSTGWRRDNAVNAVPQQHAITGQGQIDLSAQQRLGLAAEHSCGDAGRTVQAADRLPRRVAGNTFDKAAASIASRPRGDFGVIHFRGASILSRFRSLGHIENIKINAICCPHNRAMRLTNGCGARPGARALRQGTATSRWRRLPIKV
jgi:hypothetical protein